MFRKKIFIIFFLLLFASARGGEFPFCMYGLQDAADLRIIKEAGFSCFQSYKGDTALQNTLAEKASELGLKAVFYPTVIGTQYEEQAKSWPMLAWYLVDEPDVYNWTFEKLEEEDKRVKKVFPAQKTTFVLSEGNPPVSYYSAADTIMVDWYPVPHLALTSFGDHVALVKEGNKSVGQKDKPLWGVVQIFNWKEYKQYRPDNDRIGRFPEEKEIRFMTYDGIINGATGIFYFTFNSKGVPMPVKEPEWWGRVSAVSRELKAFIPILEGGKEVRSSVKTQEGVKSKMWKYQGKKYLLLLNRTDETKPLAAKLLKDKYKVFTAKEKPSELKAYETLILVY